MTDESEVFLSRVGMGLLSLCGRVADAVRASRCGAEGVPLRSVLDQALPSAQQQEGKGEGKSGSSNRSKNRVMLERSVALYLDKRGIYILDARANRVDRTQISSYFDKDASRACNLRVAYEVEGNSWKDSNLRAWQEKPTPTALAVIDALRAAGARGMFLSDLTAAVPALRKDANLIDKLVLMNVITKRVMQPLSECPRPRSSFRAVLCHLEVLAASYEPGADGLCEDLAATADGALALLDGGMDAACKLGLLDNSNRIDASKFSKFMNLPDETVDAIRSAVEMCSNHSKYKFYEVVDASQRRLPASTWMIGPGVDEINAISAPGAELSTFAEEIEGSGGSSDNVMLSLPLYEQLLHIVSTLHGGTGVTAKDIATSLGISYKRAAKQLKELVGTYGFAQETVLVKKAVMIKVLPPHWDVFADGGINVFSGGTRSKVERTVADASLSAPASSASSSSSSDALQAAVIERTSAGGNYFGSHAPSKGPLEAIDLSIGVNEAMEYKEVAASAPSTSLFQERRLATIVSFIDEMGGVASLRECQKAVQDAQTKAGIRTEVDRKTVLRAAAHLSDAGKIAVWRVPLEMETAFVLAGTTLMIWCEGAAALRGPEEALAVFNGRQEALHASRLEAKTQLAMEAGRKRGFQHDAPLDEDAYTGQPRKSKRKKISPGVIKTKAIQLPRDALDAALERRTAAGTIGVLLGMRAAGLVTSAWQLHLLLCEMLQEPPGSHLTSVQYNYEFSLSSIIRCMSVRTAVKICSLPEDYVHHLAKVLFERKPGSPPDISGFDAALVSGLKHEACMLLDLEAPDEDPEPFRNIVYSHVKSRLLSLISFLVEMRIVAFAEESTPPSSADSQHCTFALQRRPPGTELLLPSACDDEILSPEACTKYWESVAVPSLYASIRRDDGSLGSTTIFIDIRRELSEDDFRPSEYDRSLENERLKLQRARSRPVSAFAHLFTDRNVLTNCEDIRPQSSERSTEASLQYGVVGGDVRAPRNRNRKYQIPTKSGSDHVDAWINDFDMLEALLRRFLLCEGSTLPDGLKLNLLSSSDIAGGVTLPSFIAAAAAKSRGASSAAKRAWAAYLRSFLPLVGPRDQCVVSAIHARLILDVNIEMVRLDEDHVSLSFWSLLRRKGKRFFKSFKQKYFESGLSDSYRAVLSTLVDMSSSEELGASGMINPTLIRLVNEVLDASKLAAMKSEETSAIDDAVLTRVLQHLGDRLCRTGGSGGADDTDSGLVGAYRTTGAHGLLPPSAYAQGGPHYPDESIKRVQRELYLVGTLRRVVDGDKETYELSPQLLRSLNMGNAESYALLCRELSSGSAHSTLGTAGGASVQGSTSRLSPPDNLQAAYLMSKGSLSAALGVTALPVDDVICAEKISYALNVDYNFGRANFTELIASLDTSHSTADEIVINERSDIEKRCNLSDEQMCDWALDAITRAEHGGVTLSVLWAEGQRRESSFPSFVSEISSLLDKDLIFLFQRYPHKQDDVNLRFSAADVLSRDELRRLLHITGCGPDASGIVAIDRQYRPLYYHSSSASMSEGSAPSVAKASTMANRSPWREEDNESILAVRDRSSTETDAPPPSFYDRLAARVISYLARRPGSSAEAVRSALPCCSQMHVLELLRSLERRGKVRVEAQPVLSRIKSPFDASAFSRATERANTPQNNCNLLYFIANLS